MKTHLLLFLLTFASIISVSAQTERDTLTNEKIITLSKIGLQPSVIVNKIKTSVTNFDVSTDALINLSKNNVSAEVINEMMKRNESHQEAINNMIESKNPNVMHRSGIYLYNPSDLENPLKKIQVVRVSSFKASSGGYGGYGGSSEYAILSGATSKQQINGQNPTFYFYFNNQENVKADWFEGAASPNEFALVKVIVKKEQRMFKIGGSSSGAFTGGSSSGIPEKTKIQFESDEISEGSGIYKVTFKTPLQPGEYCFAFASAIQKLFDFGIKTDNEKK